MKATNFVDFPTTNGALTELACKLEAAFASDPAPIPWSAGPLRLATSAMAARKQRIFFMDTPFLFALQASDVRFTYPCSRRGCARNRMGPSRSDHKSKYMWKSETLEHYLGNICGIFGGHRGGIEGTFPSGDWIARL